MGDLKQIKENRLLVDQNDKLQVQIDCILKKRNEEISKIEERYRQQMAHLIRKMKEIPNCQHDIILKFDIFCNYGVDIEEIYYCLGCGTELEKKDAKQNSNVMEIPGKYYRKDIRSIITLANMIIDGLDEDASIEKCCELLNLCIVDYLDNIKNKRG